MGWGWSALGALAPGIGSAVAGAVSGKEGAINAAAPLVGTAISESEKKNKKTKKGGLAAPQGEFQPYTTAAPLAQGADQYAPSRFQNGQPGQGGMTNSPQGWDFSSPGVAEQFWNNQQGAVTGGGRAGDYYDRAAPSFAGPGQGEQYWNQVRGRMNAPTASSKVNDAGLDAYYDRAAQKTQEQIRNQLAASGTLGSSIGDERVADAIAGLRAEQAMRQGEFGLRSAGQADQMNMAQLGLGGQLSNQAQQLGMGRNAMGMNLAGAADASDLSRFNAGMNASMAAQDARRTRGRDMYSDVYSPAAAMSGMVGDAMGDILANDQQYMDAAMAAELGLTREMLNQSYMKADRQKDDEKHGLNSAKSIMSLVGPGGMMGGGG